jgi:hypothetical protein
VSYIDSGGSKWREVQVHGFQVDDGAMISGNKTTGTATVAQMTVQILFRKKIILVASADSYLNPGYSERESPQNTRPAKLPTTMPQAHAHALLSEIPMPLYSSRA